MAFSIEDNDCPEATPVIISGKRRDVENSTDSSSTSGSDMDIMAYRGEDGGLQYRTRMQSPTMPISEIENQRRNQEIEENTCTQQWRCAAAGYHVAECALHPQRVVRCLTMQQQILQINRESNVSSL